MKYLNAVLILLLLLSSGCSGTLKKSMIKKTPAYRNFSLTDISDGLPTEKLWRNHLALYDINSDGFLDIIVPSPRNEKPEDRRPFIFVRDTENSRWTESDYKFPPLTEYDYGGIAVGDINKDGFFDIAIANHTQRIIILLNDGNNGFKEMAFTPEKDFYSRTIRLADLNNDGWLDIVAFSEAPFVEGYKPLGILTAINLEGKDWDISFIKETMGLQGNAIHVGDYNGDGQKDIAISPFSANRDEKKLIFFGNENFFKEFFDGSQLTEQLIPVKSTSGDYDGDNIDELVYFLSGIGKKGIGLFVKAYKWDGDTLKDISTGLTLKMAFALESNDFDNDGKDELLVLSPEGLHIFRYSGNAWQKIFFSEMDYDERTRGIRGLTSGRLKDGSFLIVHNLGSEKDEINGIKGYILKWQKN